MNISPGDPVFLKSLFEVVHNLLGFVWLMGYAYFVVEASDLLHLPRVKRILDRATGVVLGLRPAFEKRAP